MYASRRGVASRPWQNSEPCAIVVGASPLQGRCPFHPRPLTSMSRHHRSIALVAALATPVAAVAQTRMLRTPTVSKTQIAFAYANNIWTVDRAGGTARRVTSFQGTTENPKFSPDGTQLAFS